MHHLLVDRALEMVSGVGHGEDKGDCCTHSAHKKATHHVMGCGWQHRE
jgi:hypothetical protein